MDHRSTSAQHVTTTTSATSPPARSRRSVLRMAAATPFALSAAALAGTAEAAPHITADGEGSRDTTDARVRDLERAYDTTIGFVAANLATGERISHRANRRFPMLSVFKTLAAAAVLRDHASRDEKLDRRVWFPPADVLDYAPIAAEHVDTGMTLEEMCDAALRFSDNTAANLLLREIGGPRGLTGFARSIGDRTTRLDRWEPELNTAIPGDERDTTSPAAIARTYVRLLVGSALHARDRRQLRRWMLDNQTSDERFRAGLPAGWALADKTGGGDYGTNNNVGVAWTPAGTPIVIAALTRRAERDASKDDALLADLARLAAERLTGDGDGRGRSGGRNAG